MADPATVGAQGAMISAGAPVVGALYGLWHFYTKGVRKAREDPASQRAELPKYSFVTTFMILVCALYGFVGALVISKNLSKDPLFVPGNAAFAAGLINGVTCFLAAVGLGHFGEVAVRCGTLQPRLMTGYTLICIYIEAFALYGLILAVLTVARAGDAKVDLAPGAAVTFAGVDLLSNLSGIVASVWPGYSIMQVGVNNPGIVMRGMIPVVMGGVTGIYGLIACFAETQIWPPAGQNVLAGVLFFISGMIIAYVGFHRVRGMHQGSSTFSEMVMTLVQGQSLGLAGLIYSLVLTGDRKQAAIADGAPGGGATWAPATLLAEGLVGGSPVFALAMLSLPVLVAFLIGARRRPSALGDALLA